MVWVLSVEFFCIFLGVLKILHYFCSRKCECAVCEAAKVRHIAPFRRRYSHYPSDLGRSLGKMVELGMIYNEDCLQTMARDWEGHRAGVILTSPPYNTSRKGAKNLGKHECRYEAFNDSRTDDEYINWTVSLFDGFGRVLDANGVVLYNLSYSSENTWLMWNVVSEIQRQTDFIVADCIVWKKGTALPNNVSPNKLTRLCEFVFVFCRKSEFATFRCNKAAVSQRSGGQVMYENVYNLIEAANNDENCPIHKATYSVALCRKLLRIYATEGTVVYDPFMGTGTTAVACVREKMPFVGSEISERYCDWANCRVGMEQRQFTLF